MPKRTKKMGLDEYETKAFVFLWNEANGFKQGIVDQANMRYRAPGIVSWNEYNAPEIDLNQVQSLLSQLVPVIIREVASPSMPRKGAK